MVGLQGLEDLAEELLSSLNGAEREAFRNWVSEALATLEPYELKGLLNRASPSIGFSSKAAHRLLSAAADRLALP